MGLKLSGVNLPSLEYRHVIPQRGDTASINPVQLLDGLPASQLILSMCAASRRGVSE